jgi:hypothetical protein
MKGIHETYVAEKHAPALRWARLFLRLAASTSAAPPARGCPIRDRGGGAAHVWTDREHAYSCTADGQVRFIMSVFEPGVDKGMPVGN